MGRVADFDTVQALYVVIGCSLGVTDHQEAVGTAVGSSLVTPEIQMQPRNRCGLLVEAAAIVTLLADRSHKGHLRRLRWLFRRVRTACFSNRSFTRDDNSKDINLYLPLSSPDILGTSWRSCASLRIRSKHIGVPSC